MGNFQIKLLKKREKMPKTQEIEAGYLLAFSEDKVLLEKSENEWVIPKWDIYGEKSLKKAFEDNFFKKYNLNCNEAEPYIVLKKNEAGVSEIYFISNEVTLNNENNLEFVDIEKILFQPNINGDKELLWVLIQNARAKLGMNYW